MNVEILKIDSNTICQLIMCSEPTGNGHHFLPEEDLLNYPLKTSGPFDLYKGVRTFVLKAILLIIINIGVFFF